MGKAGESRNKGIQKARTKEDRKGKKKLKVIPQRKTTTESKRRTTGGGKGTG